MSPAFWRRTTAAIALPAGVEVEYLEVYRNDILLKRIAGSPATVNADGWKAGSDVT